VKRTVAADDDIPRERILRTASRLFHEEGVRTVGVDRIVAESGVAKMSLYRHYRSKDELILAVIRDEDERWRAALEAELDRRAGDSRARLLALFDALASGTAAKGYRGCPFQNTAIGLADPEHAASGAVAKHCRYTRRLLGELARDAGAADPDTLADELHVLYEGGLVTGFAARNRRAGAIARAAAERLIDAQLA
jgi:AcrR family transcriptional regulator